MEAHNPAYTIPVVKRMTLVECALALGFGRTVDDAPAGRAFPDPNDKRSHLRMRKANLDAREAIAMSRHGRRFADLPPADRDRVVAEAARVAPVPESRAPSPQFVAALTGALLS
jgi:hypothetical protein